MKAPSLAICLVLLTTIVSADDRSAAELFPATTVLYAELHNPAELVDQLLQHPLRAKIESLPDVQEAYEGKQYLQFKAGVALLEAQVGKPWPKLLDAAAGKGVAVGVDAATEGVAVLIKARDEETQPKLIETAVNLARLNATSNDQPDPVKSGEHRGITAYQFGEAKVATFGPWLLITNKGDTGQAILDIFLDKPESNLATNENFAQARQGAADDSVGWGYANLDAVREAGVAKDLFKGKAENPLAELLVGGILSTLQKSPYATASVSASAGRLGVSFAIPHKPEWIPEERAYFFGPDGQGGAPPLPTAANTVLAVSAYRDSAEMWLRAGDLFDENMVDQLAQADATLTTLFSGKDFGEDILGSVRPEAQIIVTRQTFEKGTPQPAIKIPAFALAFDLKDPEKMRPELRRTYQSLIGFLNIVGAMEGQPQLNQDIEKEGDTEILSATYLPEEGANLNRLRLHFNFSPSVAFGGSRFVVSSTKGLARELITSESAEQQDPAANSVAVTDFQVLRDILADNRGQLIAQNMLEDGNTKKEAEGEIDTLLELVGMLRTASLQFDTTSEAMRLSFDVELKTE